MSSSTDHFKIERMQTGVRMERRLVKVLKGLAEYQDMTLGDLLEGIVLHAFEGKDSLQSGDPGKGSRTQGNLWLGTGRAGQPPPARVASAMCSWTGAAERTSSGANTAGFPRTRLSFRAGVGSLTRRWAAVTAADPPEPTANRKRPLWSSLPALGGPFPAPGAIARGCARNRRCVWPLLPDPRLSPGARSQFEH